MRGTGWWRDSFADNGMFNNDKTALETSGRFRSCTKTICPSLNGHHYTRSCVNVQSSRGEKIYSNVPNLYDTRYGARALFEDVVVAQCEEARVSPSAEHKNTIHAANRTQRAHADTTNASCTAEHASKSSNSCFSKSISLGLPKKSKKDNDQGLWNASKKHATIYHQKHSGWKAGRQAGRPPRNTVIYQKNWLPSQPAVAPKGFLDRRRSVHSRIHV